MARRQKKAPALLKEFEGAIAAGRYEWHAASSAGDRAADLDLQSWMETVLGEHKNMAMEEARGVRVVGSGSAGAELPSPLKSNLSELVSAPEFRPQCLSSSGGSSNPANSNTNSSNGAAAVASSQPLAPETVSSPAPAPAAAPSSASVWKSLQMRLAQDQPSPVAATAATPSLVTIEAAAGLNNNRPPTASSASAAASSSLNGHRPGTASMLNARSRPGTARPGTAGAMKRYEAEIDHMSSPPVELPSASSGSRSSASNSHNSSGQGRDTGVRSSGSVTATTLEAFINAGTDARGTGRDTEYVNGTSNSYGNGVAGAASPFSLGAVSPLEAVCAEIEAEHLHRTADIAQLFAEREHNRTDRRWVACLPNVITELESCAAREPRTPWCTLVTQRRLTLSYDHPRAVPPRAFFRCFICSIPDYFCCCITTELMLDPVVTPYGHSYERGPIEHYLRKIKVRTVCHAPCTSSALSCSSIALCHFHS